MGIFFPSSPIKEPYYSRGLRELQRLGFRTTAETPVSRRGFLAKDPAQTVEDIRCFLADPGIKILWAGRGGYGANYLYPLLARLRLGKPKAFIGSSDVSYLLWHLLDRRGLTVFYGPLVFSSLAEGRYNRESLLRVLAGENVGSVIPGKTLRPGKATAPLHGGCLSVLVSLLGTRHFPKLAGKLVIIEDVNEKPYRLDRMLWQLAQAGVLRRAAGLLFGEFPGCFASAADQRGFFREFLLRHGELTCPVLYDLPLGHAADCHTVALGTRAGIDSARYAGLQVLEAGVAK